ncbi:hypothetical protein CC78DRAFT_531775 [Lojkania enalia]|uniref:Uncharacterized protein n=1 Tax=Lojkania enalia TaxID=147567 RepID=A0A9P4N5P1_9PLEO|nr:hypothetical protein CC78DRAFT_531775 [Didymosphaeria enalia]
MPKQRRREGLVLTLLSSTATHQLCLNKGARPSSARGTKRRGPVDEGCLSKVDSGAAVAVAAAAAATATEEERCSWNGANSGGLSVSVWIWLASVSRPQRKCKGRRRMGGSRSLRSGRRARPKSAKLLV